MNTKPSAETLLQELLHGEPDGAGLRRLAEMAADDPELAARIGEELEFAELVREAFRGAGDGAGERFSAALESTGAGPKEWMERAVDGAATRYECDQLVKHLWERPERIVGLRRRLADDEWLREAVVGSRHAEAFVEALETRMWAETRTDHFVEDFAARLDHERASSQVDAEEEKVVAMRPAWGATLVRMGAVAAAVAVGAFLTVRHMAGASENRSSAVATVARASPDAVWSGGLTPRQGGELPSGRYRLDSGVVALEFESGSEMTVEGPAVFEVREDATAYVHEGVALAKAPSRDTGISLRSQGLSVAEPAPLLGIDARSEDSTEAVVFDGDGGICLSEGGGCRDLFAFEAIKAEHGGGRLVDIPYNPHAFSKTWELLSGVEKNTGSVRIELPGTEIRPGSDEGEVQVFLENESFHLGENLEVDLVHAGRFGTAGSNPGQSLQAGGNLRSYLLQLWPSGESGESGESRIESRIGRIGRIVERGGSGGLADLRSPGGRGDLLHGSVGVVRPLRGLVHLSRGRGLSPWSARARRRRRPHPAERRSPHPERPLPGRGGPARSGAGVGGAELILGGGPFGAGQHEFDGLGGGGEAEGPRHHRRRAETGVAVQSEVRAGLRLGPDRPVGPGKAGVLRAEDRANSEGAAARLRGETVVAAQDTAHQSQEAVVGGEGEVRRAYRCRISFSAGAPGDDQGDRPLAAGGDEEGLAPGVVDGVDEGVELRPEQAVGGRFGEKGGLLPHVAAGVDEAQSFRHGLHLGASHVAVERRELAVHVRHADLVEIHQRHRADAAADQRFGGPGAHAADADDAHVRGAQPRQRVTAVESADAGEAVEVVDGELGFQGPGILR